MSKTTYLESAVVAAPHADFGEGVVAVLVALRGKTIDTSMIGSNLATAIAKLKQPKAYHIVEAQPRNTMGKVQKNILRDEVKGFFES